MAHDQRFGSALLFRNIQPLGEPLLPVHDRDAYADAKTKQKAAKGDSPGTTHLITTAEASQWVLCQSWESCHEHQRTSE